MADDETGLPPFEGRIFIDEDGSVVFENLDPGLAEVALALNPDADLACEVPVPEDGGADGEEAGAEDGRADAG